MNLLAFEAELPGSASPSTLRDRYPPTARPPGEHRQAYLPVPAKYALALAFAIAWTSLSVVLSMPWLDGLSGLVGFGWAVFAITFIAYVPGFMQAFLLATIALDRRPALRDTG